VTPDDGDLERLDLHTLFPTRTTWVVLRRDRVLRGHLIELLGELAPHLERRDLLRAFEGAPAQWPPAPRWRSLHPAARRSVSYR